MKKIFLLPTALLALTTPVIALTSCADKHAPDELYIVDNVKIAGMKLDVLRSEPIHVKTNEFFTFSFKWSNFVNAISGVTDAEKGWQIAFAFPNVGHDDIYVLADSDQCEFFLDGVKLTSNEIVVNDEECHPTTSLNLQNNSIISGKIMVDIIDYGDDEISESDIYVMAISFIE